MGPVFQTQKQILQITSDGAPALVQPHRRQHWLCHSALKFCTHCCYPHILKTEYIAQVHSTLPAGDMGVSWQGLPDSYSVHHKIGHLGWKETFNGEGGLPRIAGKASKSRNFSPDSTSICPVTRLSIRRWLSSRHHGAICKDAGIRSRARTQGETEIKLVFCMSIQPTCTYILTGKHYFFTNPHIRIKRLNS